MTVNIPEQRTVTRWRYVNIMRSVALLLSTGGGTTTLITVSGMAEYGGKAIGKHR